MDIRDNPGRSRFEAQVQGQTAFLDYRRQKGILVLTYVEVPSALRGRGIGSTLVKDVLDRAREQGLQVAPICPFIRAYVQQHPEYQDLLAGRA